MKRFEGKTILVTGAGSGISAACVRRLFAEGASIGAADVRKEEVDQVVSEFGNSERIHGVGVDVSDRDQVAAFVSGAVRRFGKLSGLVNSVQPVHSFYVLRPYWSIFGQVRWWAL